MKLGVVGAGAWGTTIASICADNGHDVTLWCYEEALEKQIGANNRHVNLPGVQLSKKLKATTHLKELNGADIIVIGLASAHLYVLEGLKKEIKSQQKVVILTKGLVENQPSFFISDYIIKTLNTEKVAVLSGPNLAYEIASQKPALSVIASQDIQLAEQFQKCVSNGYFRTYCSEDLRGVECGGVLKNAIAIAAGISDGLSLGDNAKAALITRGLREIIQIGACYGANPETFMGLSGLGDLIATSHSTSSRNWTYGNEVGRNNKHVPIGEGKTVEGVNTAKIVKKLAIEKKLELPIMNAIYAILFDHESPKDQIQKLMKRTLKKE